MKKKRYHRKKRPQRVKFRRKYATSVFQRSLKALWNFTQVAVVAFLVSYGSIAVWRFYETSPLIRIETIQMKGDIPHGLKEFLPLEKNQKMIFLNIAKIEQQALAAFPELKNLSIRRHWDRSVQVVGEFREPVGILVRENQKKGLDEAGVIFPLKKELKMKGAVPILTLPNSEKYRLECAQALSKLKKQNPTFYARMKDLKTDTMNRNTVQLFDGTVIHWGDFNEATVLEKGSKVESVLERFKPKRTGATLKFINNNRIVLDKNWKGA